MTGPIVEPGTAWAPELVPPPLHRAGAIAWRVLVVVALLAIVIWLAFLLGTVTASILVALIVGATFAPVTRGLRARGWSRAKASAVVTVSAVLVAGAVIALVIFAFVPYAGQIATYRHDRCGGAQGAAPGRPALARCGNCHRKRARGRPGVDRRRARRHGRERRRGGDRRHPVALPDLLRPGGWRQPVEPHRAVDRRAASGGGRGHRLGRNRARRWLPARHRDPGRRPGDHLLRPALPLRRPAGRSAGRPGLCRRLHPVHRAAGGDAGRAAHRTGDRWSTEHDHPVRAAGHRHRAPEPAPAPRHLRPLDPPASGRDPDRAAHRGLRRRHDRPLCGPAGHRLRGRHRWDGAGSPGAAGPRRQPRGVRLARSRGPVELAGAGDHRRGGRRACS